MLYLPQTEEPARTRHPDHPPEPPQQFIARWQAVTLTERAACQSHFLDLCALLGVPGRVAADPTSDWFAFEKGVITADGYRGFADVWRKGHFGPAVPGLKRKSPHRKRLLPWGAVPHSAKSPAEPGSVRDPT